MQILPRPARSSQVYRDPFRFVGAAVGSARSQHNSIARASSTVSASEDGLVKNEFACSA